jgi:S1-C subfamily serine protease
VLVTDVYRDGPAGKAGVKQGDLILAIDGQPVNDEGALNYRVVTRRPGEDVALKLRRDKGRIETVRVRIAPPPGDLAKAGSVIEGKNPLGGATVVAFSPAVADQLGFDAFSGSSGVLVTRPGDGYAASFGVQAGDVVVAVNDRKVATVADLRAALASARSGWLIVIQRGDQTLTLRVRL